MRNAYPIVMTKTEEGIAVFVPDFEINTEGKDLADAMEMARDAIGLIGIDMEDDGETIPAPRPLDAVSARKGEIVSLVDVDFTEYRRRQDMASVRKNCTVPAWLNREAEKAGVNFSQVLQNALRAQLGL